MIRTPGRPTKGPCPDCQGSGAWGCPGGYLETCDRCGGRGEVDMVRFRCDSCGYTFGDTEDCVGHSCGRCEEGTIWVDDDDPDGENYQLYCELHPQEDPEEG